MGFAFCQIASSLPALGGWQPPDFQGESWPFPGGDLQTLRSVLRPPKLDLGPAEKILIPARDGDQLVSFLHLPDDAGNPNRPNYPNRPDYPDRPATDALIIGLHGLSGSSESWHLRALTRAFLDRGLAVLRVNMRGAGVSRPLCQSSYSARSGNDLALIIRAMQARFAGPIFISGVSLGGTVALNLALDEPDLASQLAGLVSISAPLDMQAASTAFHRPRNWLYMRYILSGLKKLALASPHPARLPADPNSIRSVREFDDCLTAPMHGFADAAAYYRRASVAGRLANLACPALILQADNDPWVPAAAARAARLAARTSLIITRGGGHVGFADGQQQPWFVRCAASWVAQMA